MLWLLDEQHDLWDGRGRGSVGRTGGAGGTSEGNDGDEERTMMGKNEGGSTQLTTSSYIQSPTHTITGAIDD